MACCRRGCDCSVEPGPGINIDGAGTGTSPWVFSADPLDCADVTPCLSGGPGITYDPATGTITVQISSETDNVAVIGPDGGVYVPATDVDQDVEWVFDCGGP